MTISSTTNRAQFNCNGSTTSFPFTFKYLADSDLQVYLSSPAGVVTLLTLNVDYEITPAVPGPGGTLSFLGTYLSSPPVSGYTLTILRFIARTQEVDFINGDSLDENNIEGMGDKLTMMVQDLDERIGRAVTVPPSSALTGIRLPTPEAGKFIRWNSTADNLEAATIADPSVQVVNEFWTDILAAAGSTLAEALAAMGLDPSLATLSLPDDLAISAYAKTLLDDASAGAAKATLGFASKYASDYASLAAAVTAIGATRCDLIVDTDEAVDDDLSIPATASLVVKNGAIITIASGKVLTILGPFKADQRQVFAGAGTVSFGIGYFGRIFPMWWADCLPDGSTDCGPAFNKAIASAPRGGTIWIPEGKWRISTQVQVSTWAAKTAGYPAKIVNFKGEGAHSVLWIQGLSGSKAIVVGPEYDAATEMDAPTNYLYNLDWRDFSILGGATCCASALLLRVLVNCKFRNIHVFCGATVAAVELDWVLCSDLEFYVTQGAGLSFLPYVASAPYHGIYGHISSGSGGKSVFNANRFYAIIEGCTGLGFNLECYSTTGKNEVSGVIQSVTDYGLQIYGGQGVHLHDLYLEPAAASQNELLLIDHNYGYIGPNVVTIPGYDGYNEIAIQNCDDTVINGLTCSRIYIHTDCNRTHIQSMRLQAAAGTAALTDSGAGTIWNPRYIASGVWDPPSIAAGAYTAQAFTCPGAALGMAAGVAPPYSIGNMQATAYVYAADTVVVVLHNVTGGAVDLGSGTWKVWAERI